MIPERLRDPVSAVHQHPPANLPVDGMLRLDHVMALFRLFCSHTEPKTPGAYVNYRPRNFWPFWPGEQTAQ
jgi:hypothetical protein